MSMIEHTTPASNSTRWRWPAIHREGHKFALIAAAITGFFAVMSWETLAWPMAGITLWVLAFFRDPRRTTPRAPGLVIAPADGLVTMIQPVPVPKELAGPDGLGDSPLTRISIFMSVFDVHINRAPIGGTIKRVVYISGKFLNADLDKASEDNERQHFLVEDQAGLRIGFTQIAGLVARRILPFVKPGDLVAVGQRIGLIRFGSRVDVYLPAGTAAQVIVGQRTIAGETILAGIGVTESPSGVTA
jgi:phosphatidylserine decarboxylase